MTNSKTMIFWYLEESTLRLVSFTCETRSFPTVTTITSRDLRMSLLDTYVNKGDLNHKSPRR